MKHHINKFAEFIDNEERLIVKFLRIWMAPIVAMLMYVLFIISTRLIIKFLINPYVSNDPVLEIHFVDFVWGFILYFITAVDYAILVGRIQVKNPGIKARFIMNIFTCLGGYIGVELVLLMWGHFKEIDLLIIPILFFAGNVMIRLAHEGHEYYTEDKEIPTFFKNFLYNLVKFFYPFAKFFTFWMPYVTPKAEKFSSWKLAYLSFILPFLIGLDDLVGYFGAMTIFNAFGLVSGILFADVFIDILLFTKPKFTTKVVQNGIVAVLGTLAFLYLGYKSFSEMVHILEDFNFGNFVLIIIVGLFIVITFFDPLKTRSKKYI